LLEGIAEENSGTEEDGGDQIKRKKRLREIWNEPPSDEFERVLENCCCKSERKTDSRARGIATQIEKPPPQQSQKPYCAANY